MNRMEILLYLIILGLVINLIANTIWKYIPTSDKNIDKIISIALVFICVLLVFYVKERPSSEKRNTDSKGNLPADTISQIPFQYPQNPDKPPPVEAKGFQINEIDNSGTLNIDNIQGDKIVISGLSPRDSASQVTIHILKHYRTRFQFSIVNEGATHWAVHRLYLKYVSEFDWDLGPTRLEALMFQLNYGIALSRQYSEYDLLPLTPDQEVHGFEYRGPDSDHFSIQLYGTDVSIIKICADTYNYDTEEHGTIESEEIRVVSSPTRVPKWDSSLKVTPYKLLDDIRPLSYKVLISLNYDEFLRKLTPYQHQEVKSDLLELLSSASGRSRLDENCQKDYEDYLQLRTEYDADKSSLSEKDLKRLCELMQMLTAGKGFAANDAFINRLHNIIKEIEKIERE